MSDFECHCGKTFATAQRLGAHRTSHETVVCETCGATVGRQGSGGHRKAHRVAAELEEALAVEAEIAEAHEIETARVIAGVRDLTPPEIGRDALERAAELLDKHPDHRGCFVVAGATYGPHLTSRQNVGGVVAKAGEPCLVIDLNLLAPVESTNERWR